jgi:hypothetical protein
VVGGAVVSIVGILMGASVLRSMMISASLPRAGSAAVMSALTALAMVSKPTSLSTSLADTAVLAGITPVRVNSVVVTLSKRRREVTVLFV